MPRNVADPATGVPILSDADSTQRLLDIEEAMGLGGSTQSRLSEVSLDARYSQTDHTHAGGGGGGADGASAYEVAVANGFVGTEAQWLTSLEGAAGGDGTNGTDGVDGLGWTGGSYDALTGVVTFASDDGLGFATGDLRGADGASGSGSGDMVGANNLSDVTDAAASRTNLGLGTAATSDTGDFATAAQGALAASALQPAAADNYAKLDTFNVFAGDQVVAAPNAAFVMNADPGTDGSMNFRKNNITRFLLVHPGAEEDRLSLWAFDTAGVFIKEYLTIDQGDDAVTYGAPVFVPAEPYATSWNGNNSVPTKNDVYDAVEAIALTPGPAGQDGTDGTDGADGITGVEITQAAYDALGTPTAGVLYLVVG